MIGFAALFASSLLPATAASGTLYSINVTQPAGAIWIGHHLWESDGLQRFCRIDSTATAQPGAFVVDPGSPDYCYSGNVIPGLVTGTGGQGTGGNIGFVPGQAAYDSATNFIYIPDRSSKSLGVWRVQYDPATETVVAGSGLIVAPNKGLGGLRTTSVALGADGSLYVGSHNTGDIKRVPNPSSAVETQIVQTIGKSITGKRVFGMVFVNSDLYLAEADGVGVIRNATACQSGCAAVRVAAFPSKESTAIASDGGDTLYVTQPPNLVYSGSISGGTASVLASSGQLEPGQPFPISVYPTSNCVDVLCPFSFLSGQNSALGVDPAGTLYVGDDPGATVTSGFPWNLRGRIWSVAP
jgi:hypothetical protein